MQEAFQKMAGAVSGVPRIVVSGRDWNPGAVPDDAVRGSMGLEGDGEDE